MKKNNNSDEQFEQFVRNGLNKMKPVPDADTWPKIAAEQAAVNRANWRRRYMPRAAALLLFLLVAGVGIRQLRHHKDASLAGNATAPVSTAPVSTEITPTNDSQFSTAILQNQVPQQLATASKKPFSTYDRKQDKVPVKSARFQAEKGYSYYDSSTGTRVDVPAKALVHQDGTPVFGEVELRMQEYRNIADYLASGIPMHYGDERGDYYFNSGGMFNLQAFQNGEELAIKSGEALAVNFVPTQVTPNASFYYYDENAGKWGYDPALSNGKNTPVIINEAAAKTTNRQVRNLNCLPPTASLPDQADPSDWVKEGIKTGYSLAFGQEELPRWFTKNINSTDDKLLEGMEQSLVRLVRHNDNDNLFFPEDLNGVFTELKALRGCYFIHSTETSKGDNFSILKSNTYWKRVNIRPDNGNNCYISLYSDEEGLVQFYATIIGSIENTNFNAEKVLTNYCNLRADRQRDFLRQVTRWRRFLFTAPVFQENDEWCMSQQDWLIYFNNNLPAMRKRYDNLVKAGLTTDNALAVDCWKKWTERSRELLFAAAKTLPPGAMNAGGAFNFALRVTNFGLYNCDQIYRLGGDLEYVEAAFNTPNGQRISPASINVLERSSRLFFTMTDSRLVWAPNRVFDIIIMAKDGKRYRVNPNTYAEAISKKQSGKKQLTAVDITDQTVTPRDWARLLDI